MRPQAGEQRFGMIGWQVHFVAELAAESHADASGTPPSRRSRSVMCGIPRGEPCGKNPSFASHSQARVRDRVLAQASSPV